MACTRRRHPAKLTEAPPKKQPLRIESQGLFFTPNGPPTGTAMIANSLREQIVNADMVVNDNLPGEKELIAARRYLRPQRRHADDEGHDGAVPLPPGLSLQGRRNHPVPRGRRRRGPDRLPVGRAMGVTMIGTVSTDEKAAIAKDNGCTHTSSERSTRTTCGARVRMATRCFRAATRPWQPTSIS